MRSSVLRAWPVLAALCLLFLDSRVPLGFAVWLGYIGLLVALPPQTRYLEWYAAFFALFIVAGAFFSAERAAAVEVIAFNRLAACLLLGVTLLLLKSRRNLLDSLVESRAEAVEANAAKTRFLSYVSHDLRTPLNGILARLDVLLQSAGELRTEQVRDLKYVESLVLLLNDFIQELLEYAEVGAARNALETEDVDVPAALQEMRSLFEPMLAEGVSLHIETQPLRLKLDRKKLRHILVNLLSNSTKFTAAGDIAVRAFARGERFVIDVQDTGRGASPKLLKEMFVEGVSEDPGRGLGMGLALSNRFAYLMGGTLSATSGGEGFGMTVRLDLPLVRA